MYSTLKLETRHLKKSKNIPNSFYHDQERMYEEIQGLKREKNGLIEENKGLKGRIINYEKDEKSALNELNKAPDQANLIASLKRSLYKRTTELQETQSELLNLKRLTTRTRIEELELEAAAFREESKKLRFLLEEEFIGATEKETKAVKKLDIIIEKLKSDNSDFGVLIRELEEDNEKLKNKLAKRDKEITKIEKDKSSYKRALQEKISQIESLQQSEASTLHSLKASLRNELQAKEDDIEHLESQLSKKEMKVTELEVEVRSRQKEIEELVERDMKERQILKESLESKKLEIESLKKQVEIHSTFQDRRASAYIHSRKLKGAEEIVEYEKKRVPRVMKYEVEKIVVELRFCLMMHKIPISKLEEVMFSSDIRIEGKVSISNLILLLKKFPFFFKNDEQLLMLSRYLVEPNDEDYFILDTSRNEELSIVMSRFKNLVGAYVVYDQREEESMGFDVASKIGKFYNSLKNIIQNKITDSKKAGAALPENMISREDFDFSLQYIDMGLSDKQLDFMYMKLYERIPEIGPISVTDLFELFGPKSTYTEVKVVQPKIEEVKIQVDVEERRFKGELKERNEDANSESSGEDQDFEESKDSNEKKSENEFGSKYNSSKYNESKYDVSKIS